MKEKSSFSVIYFYKKSNYFNRIMMKYFLMLDKKSLVVDTLLLFYSFTFLIHSIISIVCWGYTHTYGSFFLSKNFAIYIIFLCVAFSFCASSFSFRFRFIFISCLLLYYFQYFSLSLSLYNIFIYCIIFHTSSLLMIIKCYDFVRVLFV